MFKFPVQFTILPVPMPDGVANGYSIMNADGGFSDGVGREALRHSGVLFSGLRRNRTRKKNAVDNYSGCGFEKHIA